MGDANEIKFAKFLSLGLFVTTILVIAGPVSEPVNLTKMLSLVVFTFGSIPFLFYFKKEILKNKVILVLISFFIVFLLISTLHSESPISQNVYGIYGRNTGFLTYFSFAVLTLIISNLRTKKSYDFLILSVFAAATVNIVYGMWVQFFGDPIKWNNIYGALLGTFGNPNFSGAFYGMTSAGFLGLSLGVELSRKTRFGALFLGICGIACVLLTKTTQGVLVFGLSFSIIILIFILKKLGNRYVGYFSILSFIIIAFIVIMGILQKGPLSSILYKRSVSLRGVYWDAAMDTGKSNLLFGSGPDSFGDWYRLSRSEKAATWLPGPETITNAAHNYYLDIFANGGIFLLLIYVALSLLGFYSALKIYRNMKTYDYFGAVLIAMFVGFQAQSIISISQIGIAIWGWVFIGLLYSYAEKTGRQQNDSKSGKVKVTKESPTGVLIFITMSIGFVIAVPPFAADYKWTQALNSQDLAKIESALTSTYFSPSNSDRLANAVLILEQSNLPVQAHKYALAAVNFNKNNFNAWKVLYYATNSTNDERQVALKNMKRLDPLNKNLDNLK